MKPSKDGSVSDFFVPDKRESIFLFLCMMNGENETTPILSY